MPTASDSATSASSRIHPIALRFPVLPRAATGAVSRVVACALLFGCVTQPVPKVVPPTVPPVPVAPPPSTAPASLPATYQPVAWSALPGWSDDRVQDAWPAFRVGCPALVAKPATQALWQPACAAAATIDARNTRAIRSFFETNFIPYRIQGADGSDTGMITGYYEPLLAGSRTKSARYSVPIYAVPDDLLTIDLTELYPELKDKRLRGRVEGKRVVPYWARTDIVSGLTALDGKTLAYVADPVEAFFLQIQGSGRIRLDDGSAMRVGYADQNCHPYRSIGTVLIERGELTLPQASMQGIREWGRRNPDKLPALLDENPSFVFFRVVPPPAPGTLEAEIDGPFGALGVPLLAQRTMAVDRRSVPLGAPVFLATTYPLSEKPLQRLMLAQDTGGAIRGAVRGDFFWGFGDDAGREAGRMRQQGRMWILWPKNAPPPKP